MDHGEALSSRAVERYVLGEMPEPETESFERHYFECAVCTEDLRSATLLAENMRAVLADDVPALELAPAARPEPLRTGWAWLKGLWRPAFAVPAFAAAILAAVVFYQAGELARARKPQVLLAFALKSASRGETESIVVPAGRSYFVIAPDDLPETAFPDYRYSLYDSAGRIRFSVVSAAPSGGGSFQLLVPVRGLEPGGYSLRVFGLRGSQPASEVARYSFALQLR
jgi:hypothetical protein